MKKGMEPTIWIIIVAVIAIIVAYMIITLFGKNISSAGELVKTNIGGAGKGLVDIISKI